MPSGEPDVEVRPLGCCRVAGVGREASPGIGDRQVSSGRRDEGLDFRLDLVQDALAELARRQAADEASIGPPTIGCRAVGQGVEELPPEVRLFQRSGPEVDLCCRFTGERGKADAEAVSEKGPGGLFDAIGSLVGPGVSRAFRQQGPRRFVSGGGV